MKSMVVKTLGLVAMATAYSHALFGIGATWAPAPNLEVGSDSGAVANGMSLNEKGVSGLNGLGLKLWLDFLPFIDIEASSNIQYGYYDLDIIQGGTVTPVKFDLGVPFVEGKPVFARIASDISVLYPFLRFPPAVSILKVYAGGGLTHVMASEVLTASFGKQAVDKAIAGGKSASTAAEVQEILADAIKDEGLKNGVGFHLMAGVKAKVPIIPIAAFANAKYHFLSSMPSATDANALTLEVGGALAF